MYGVGTQYGAYRQQQQQQQQNPYAMMATFGNSDGGVGTGNTPQWQSSIFDYFGMQQGDAQVIGGAAQGIGAAFGIYNAFQQQKMAKQQFAFQKEAYYTNLRNQSQSYNTQLQDRINGRHSAAERTQEQKQADYDKNKLGG